MRKIFYVTFLLAMLFTVSAPAGAVPRNLSHLLNNPVKTAVDIPTSFDLRSLDVVPPVRNQTLWGTCWAHATMAAVETNYLMQLSNETMTAIPEIGSTSKDVDLSEMHIAWFAFMGNNIGQRFTNTRAKNLRTPTGYSAINEGAYIDVAAAILARGYGWGPVSEKDMPYIGQYIAEKDVRDVVGEKRPDESEDAWNKRYEAEIERRTDPWCLTNLRGKLPTDYTSLLRLKDAAYFVNARQSDSDSKQLLFKHNQDSIKQLIMEKGAIIINYAQGGKASNDSYYYSGTDNLHAVTVIGWDDNYPASRFVPDSSDRTPSTNGAWLIRNSWGENAEGHNGGYFWLSYEQAIDCGTAFTMASADSSLRTYTHSDLGWSASWGNHSTTFYGASVFKAGANGGTLRELGFYTTDNGAEIEFSVYRYGTTKPTAENLTSGTPVITQSSGTVTYAGYHTLELTSPVSVEAGEYFAVVQKAVNPSYQYPLAVSAKIDNWSDFAKFYDSEGYISSNGSDWTDGVGITSDDKSMPLTPCLYAFMSGTAEGDNGLDRDGLKIAGIPVESYKTFTREINVPDEVNDALNPNLSGDRIFNLTLGGVDGKAAASGKDFTIYILYTEDLLHWSDSDSASKSGVRVPSGDVMPLYPKGYKPDVFLTYGITDDFGYTLSVDLPAYGPFVLKTGSGGKITLDLDDLTYADIGDVDRAGELADIPSGYFDLHYFAQEDTESAASGVITGLKAAESSGNSSYRRRGASGSNSGCNAGVVGLVVLLLIGTISLRKTQTM